MIVVRAYAGKKCGILGLGRTGTATARALIAGGAEVWAWDDAAPARAALAAELPAARLVDFAAAEVSPLAGLVASPGVPLHFPRPHPAVAHARKQSVPVLGDIDLLMAAQPDARYVAITGTNGKSTTTALIGHLLTRTGHRVEVGGNLGTPALDLAPLGKGGVYVLEMSSYQLDLLTRHGFDVAALLNVTPDHIDRHGSMDGYIAAKRRIFDRPRAQATAVVGIDDEPCLQIYRALAGESQRRVIAISSATQPVPGVFVDNGVLHDALDRPAERVVDLANAIALPGRHNWQNAAAAYAAGLALGLSRQAIAAGLLDFPGLAHRQELIAVIDGIRFVNDSKATNADAAAKALACYDGIYWIAGGRPKEGGIAGLESYFDRIRHAFLIGEATEAFAATLRDKVAVTRSGTLANAVRQAFDLARSERGQRVVLLSPACASFDQWRDFEARGEGFRIAVRQLEGVGA